MESNRDAQTIEGFGEEWSRFDQSGLSSKERRDLFGLYFRLFPWSDVDENAVGFDFGCGSGRWASCVAPKVGRLHCIDASSTALSVAERNLSAFDNVRFHNASAENIPLADHSMDFGYSLGVLHHIPDTAQALKSCVAKLKPGAPFLVYLYYAFDNRPGWFRALWKGSDMMRRIICRAPFRIKSAICDIIAFSVYLPLARSALILEKLGLPLTRVSMLPLSSYRDKSLYTMRTDALDRFGTRLEQRFSKSDIAFMMGQAGLEEIKFFPKEPFWCAVGRRK